MSGPTSFAARWYFGESHLPHRYGNRHVRQSPAESALSESTTAILHQTGWSFSRTGGFQHSILLCNGSRIRRLCGKNLKLCEVTVKSKRGQHATFLHVAQRDFAVKQTGDLTDKRQPQTAAFAHLHAAKSKNVQKYVTARSQEYHYRYPAP